MSTIMQNLEKAYVAELTEGKTEIPEFGPGDTVEVAVIVVEGSKSRIQKFAGVCIARKNDGFNSSFTVRKISYGEGVERVFPLFSPSIDSIKVMRRGSVRRSKLYYLRELRGKAARITEKRTWNTKDAANAKEAANTPVEAASAKPEATSETENAASNE